MHYYTYQRIVLQTGLNFGGIGKFRLASKRCRHMKQGWQTALPVKATNSQKSQLQKRRTQKNSTTQHFHRQKVTVLSDAKSFFGARDFFTVRHRKRVISINPTYPATYGSANNTVVKISTNSSKRFSRTLMRRWSPSVPLSLLPYSRSFLKSLQVYLRNLDVFTSSRSAHTPRSAKGKRYSL